MCVLSLSIYVYIYIYTHISTIIHTTIPHISLSLYVCVYIYIYIYIQTHLSLYIYIYICTYTPIQLQYLNYTIYTVIHYILIRLVYSERQVFQNSCHIARFHCRISIPESCIFTKLLLLLLLQAVLVHWYTGTLAHWYPGTQVHCYAATLLRCYAATPVCWYPAALLPCYPVALVHRCTGTCTGTGACTGTTAYIGTGTLTLVPVLIPVRASVLITHDVSLYHRWNRNPRLQPKTLVNLTCLRIGYLGLQLGSGVPISLVTVVGCWNSLQTRRGIAGINKTSWQRYNLLYYAISQYSL